MRTAQNWSLYQMWVNKMMNPDKHLTNGQPDSLPESFEFYGYDPYGPSPFENSNNNVVLEPVSIANGNEIQSELLQSMDPLQPSVQMGIDIYAPTE